MYTSKLTKGQLFFIAIILLAVATNWVLIWTMQSRQFVPVLLQAQLTLVAFSFIGYHLERVQRRRQVKLLEAAFAGLEPALVILFEALTGKQHSRYGEFGLQAYLLWKTEYVQEFGVSTIVDYACRGTLPAPMSGPATLTIPTHEQEAIRRHTLAATATVR
ncbi:MAG TPA: hypothetical protein VFT59_01740 [Candidatus Saccharimonadales bacterium]|nr:hypothetical protein [Candidatus Saccharimonadales bacterium]